MPLEPPVMRTVLPVRDIAEIDAFKRVLDRGDGLVSLLVFVVGGLILLDSEFC